MILSHFTQNKKSNVKMIMIQDALALLSKKIKGDVLISIKEI